MNKNINLAISTIIIIFSVLIGYALVVSAQSLEINYPIKELGNCGNETECKVFVISRKIWLLASILPNEMD